MKDRTSDILCEIEAERIRQIDMERFTVAHDDAHDARELARAAGAYVQHYFERQWLIPGAVTPEAGLRVYRGDSAPDCWPWDEECWKPKNPRRDLIRAIALLVAEVELMDRKSQATQRLNP